MPSRPLPGFAFPDRIDTEPGLNRPATLTRFRKSPVNTGLNRVNRVNQDILTNHSGKHECARVDGQSQPTHERPSGVPHGCSHKPGSVGSPGSSQQGRAIERTGLALEPGSTRFKARKGGLIARLCEAGATVRTYIADHNCLAVIEAPAHLPEALIQEIETKGWRIIPGGKPNPDAEHDSWLAGVPRQELDR